MSTTKQYEVCFTENNKEQEFIENIINVDIARNVAEIFKKIKETSNVRILEMSNFNRTIKFIL